jgi:hypothetical protein
MAAMAGFSSFRTRAGYAMKIRRPMSRRLVKTRTRD